MNGMSDFSEPLKLSEKQLRIELDWDRTLDGDRNYSKRTEVLTGRFDFDDRRKIRDLEMLIKPNLDPEFWSDLLKTRVKFGGTQLYSTHISMMSNIIFCALAGRETYQDPDGTWHIPLYCGGARHRWLFLDGNMSGQRLTWFESPPEPKGLYLSIALKDVPLKISNGNWTVIEYSRVMMLIFRFEEPTLLERVILHSYDHEEVFEESRICSIEIMESKIYGIILDPQIKDLTQLAEEMDNYVKRHSGILSADLRISPPGVSISNYLRINLETYPHSIP